MPLPLKWSVLTLFKIIFNNANGRLCSLVHKDLFSKPETLVYKAIVELVVHDLLPNAQSKQTGENSEIIYIC